MNINIILRIDQIDSKTIDKNLIDIIKTDNILIQSDENSTFCNINNGDNNRLIIFGNIIGKTPEDIQLEFQQSISKYSIEYFINKRMGKRLLIVNGYYFPTKIKPYLSITNHNSSTTHTTKI